tara:strand:- start:5 stop:220 length:216 start_codon:yes stop_codon:yes gene_type:complete
LEIIAGVYPDRVGSTRVVTLGTGANLLQAMPSIAPMIGGAITNEIAIISVGSKLNIVIPFRERIYRIITCD